VLGQAGKRAVISNSDYDSSVDEGYLEYAITRGFCGVIMLSAIETPGLSSLLADRSIPVVLVNRYLRSMDMDVVSIDNFRSGFMGTNYLIEAGHTRIAHLGGPENSVVCQDRLHGYRDALSAAGIKADPDGIFHGDLQYESGLKFGEFLARNPGRFTAVFSANDLMAKGLAEALFESGLRVPEDISITCFDNTVNAVNGRVRLTTISYDGFAMGVSAGEMLLNRIENPSAPYSKVFYSPTLTERDSVRSL
jgi:DNA-binding LacI/PurR family transcriptional regulator